MSRQSNKAFTLIELLVVIAIIAILAAILFPVFAQAKEAAKDSANLSNAKQTGLAHLQYSADYDDQFPLAVRVDSEGFAAWQDLIQPYSKNRDILINTKGPGAVKTPAATYALYSYQYMGVLPRAGMTAGTVGGFWSTQASNFLVGGQIARFDGIMGAGIEAGRNYNTVIDRPVPSLSQTAIQNISEVVMVAEGGMFDFGMAAFSSGGNAGWTCGGFATGPYGAGGALQGSPHARKTPTGSWQGYSCTGVGSGRTTYVATDGSAKTADLRGRIWQTASDGTNLYVKRFYSGATN